MATAALVTSSEPLPPSSFNKNFKNRRNPPLSASCEPSNRPHSNKNFWVSLGAAAKGLLFPPIRAAECLDGGKCLQNGGIGVALLSLTATAKVKFSPVVVILAVNPTLISGLLAWLAAESTKVVLNFFSDKKFESRVLFGCGGMPSSQSALCTALTTSVGLSHGIADSLFPVSLGFSLIVMYDAIGVRRHAGLQARVLNVIVEDLFEGHPISRRKFKELVGHTLSQVIAGALLGFAVACLCHQACFVPL